MQQIRTQIFKEIMMVWLVQKLSLT